MMDEKDLYCLYDARYHDDPERALVLVMDEDLKELREFRDTSHWGDGNVIVKMERQANGSLRDGEVIYD